MSFGGIPIQNVSRNQAVAVVRRALALGMNFIDTARGYSVSEGIIGEAIRGLRSECVIATKTMARTAQEAEKDLQTSLSQLGMESVDLYQIHNVNNDEALEQVMKPQGVLDSFKKARREGKIKFIGITSHRPSVLVKAIKSGEFDTIMVPLNYVERTPISELLPLATQLDVGTIVMKPLGGGAFTNVEDALKFVLKQSISTVAVGVCTIKEVKQSVAVGNMPFTFDRDAEIRLEEQAKTLGKSFCRACDYCQPCPENIPISALTRADTYIKRMGFENWHTIYPGAVEKYENCQKCRKCETRCPYQLSILEIMATKVTWLRKEYRHKLAESKPEEGK